MDCPHCDRKFSSNYSLGSHLGHCGNSKRHPITQKLLETRYCECGCGETFEVKITSKKRFVPGHYFKVEVNKRKPDGKREIKSCACGCGRLINDLVSRNRKFFSKNCINRGRTPFIKGKRHSAETKEKMRNKKLGGKYFTVDREIRICACGCGESFECKVNSVKKFIYKHSVTTEKFRIGASNRMIERGTEYMDWLRSKASTKNVINKKESLLLSILEKLFGNDYEWVGNFKVVIESKSPDFINVNGQKKIIELFGNYWHGEKRRREFYNDNDTNEVHEQKRKDLFAKYGYQTLIIWEKELRCQEELENKLIKFHNYMKEK